MTPSTAAASRPHHHGLATAITADRLLHEITQELRRATTCEAVAIALLDGAAAGPAPALRFHVGFDESPAAIQAMCQRWWADALEGGVARRDTAPAGTVITAPVGARGAVSVVMGQGEDEAALARLTAAVASVASEAAAALERVDSVAQLVARERMHGMETLAASLAHELRNPAFAVSSAAQLLRFSVQEDPLVEKNVGRILREAERLNALVAALLEYGRPAPLRLAIADPDDSWDAVLESHRGTLESRAVLVQRAVASPRAAAMVDAEQLAQALGHLLRNAVEATPEGGDVSLDSGIDPVHGWRCRLTNPGAIAPEDASRAFDPFFSTRPGHTGIGLAVAHRVIAGHGGTLRIERVGDRATCVTVTIPLRR
jgi:signal transduction histidine kinase